MLQSSNLFLFTSCYPFVVAGDSFLEVEIEEIAPKFKSIYLIPCFKETENSKPLPANVTVLSGFFEKFNRHSKGNISPMLLIKAAFHTLKNFSFTFLSNPNQLIFTFKYFIKTFMLENWVLNNRVIHEAKNSIFYTYWLDFQGSAFARLKQRSPKHLYFSRAHGYDLYDYKKLWPERIKVLQDLDFVLSVSQKGTQYLKNKAPKAHILTSHLGSKLESTDIIETQPENQVTIISTSNITLVKRVDFIYVCLKAFAKKSPTTQIIWHHFGGGDLDIGDHHLSNLDIKLHGLVTLDKVLDFYKKTNIDALINLSTSEGLPVSMMEAQSFGVPVIAPNVGGISEIVTSKNGVLLSADPNVDDVVKAFESILEKEKWAQKRTTSKQNFLNKFESKRNYTLFLQLLHQMKRDKENK